MFLTWYYWEGVLRRSPTKCVQSMPNLGGRTMLRQDLGSNYQPVFLILPDSVLSWVKCATGGNNHLYHQNLEWWHPLKKWIKSLYPPQWVPPSSVSSSPEHCRVKTLPPLPILRHPQAFTTNQQTQSKMLCCMAPPVPNSTQLPFNAINRIAGAGSNSKQLMGSATSHQPCVLLLLLELCFAAFRTKPCLQAPLQCSSFTKLLWWHCYLSHMCHLFQEFNARGLSLFTRN